MVLLAFRAVIRQTVMDRGHLPQEEVCRLHTFQYQQSHLATGQRHLRTSTVYYMAGGRRGRDFG